MDTLTAQNIFLDENTGGKGRHFTSRFLQPGLVKYSFGVCLLAKETIDKFIYQFVGCPVIINHKDVTNESAKDDRMGVVSRVWFDQMDGWYWCEGIIFEEQAISLIEDGYNVSCQYEIIEYSNNTTKALHNGNPYDKVILNGKPEHLAIVKTPRYESAMIAVNALDLTAENEDKWITIHPNGEDAKGKHLLLKDGETPQEAIERQYGNGGQMALGFPGAKKAQKDAKSYENKKIVSRDKLYSVYLNDDVKEYGKKLVEALKEYNKYNDDGVDIENIDDFVEKYEKQRNEEKANTAYKKYVKEALSKAKSDTKDKQTDSKGDSKQKKPVGISDISNILADESKFKQFADDLFFEDINANISGDLMKELYKIRKSNDYSSKAEWDEKLKRKLKQIIKSNTAKNTIIQAINEIKETNMFKNLFNKKEQKMEKDELKEIFMDCIQDVLKAQNEAEEEKKKIDDAENEDEEKEEKAENKKACNEDKRKLIDEVAGMMKSAGCDDEVIRTAIAKMEKIGYDKSEAGTADNGKKAKCEDEEEKEEALNKAKNSIEVLKGLISQADVKKADSKYITKAQAIELGNQLF